MPGFGEHWTWSLLGSSGHLAENTLLRMPGHRRAHAGIQSHTSWRFRHASSLDCGRKPETLQEVHANSEPKKHPVFPQTYMVETQAAGRHVRAAVGLLTRQFNSCHHRLAQEYPPGSPALPSLSSLPPFPPSPSFFLAFLCRGLIPEFLLRHLQDQITTIISYPGNCPSHSLLRLIFMLHVQQPASLCVELSYTCRAGHYIWHPAIEKNPRETLCNVRVRLHGSFSIHHHLATPRPYWISIKCTSIIVLAIYKWKLFLPFTFLKYVSPMIKLWIVTIATLSLTVTVNASMV